MMHSRIDDPATGGSDDKIKMANIHLIRLRRTIVPTFHYSIFETNSEVPKKPLYSQ